MTTIAFIVGFTLAWNLRHRWDIAVLKRWIANQREDDNYA